MERKSITRCGDLFTRTRFPFQTLESRTDDELFNGATAPDPNFNLGKWRIILDDVTWNARDGGDYHQALINESIVPEPGTYMLVWNCLISPVRASSVAAIALQRTNARQSNFLVSRSREDPHPQAEPSGAPRATLGLHAMRMPVPCAFLAQLLTPPAACADQRTAPIAPDLSV